MKPRANGSLTIQRVSRLRGIPTDRALRKWVRAALPQPANLTVRIVNAQEGRRLNADFRGKDAATNVLTFVYHDPGADTLEGDIVLCAPVVACEAREQGKLLEHHWAHLMVHGVLHLAGYDHIRKADARVMEAREREILATLGIADPYAPL